MKTGIITLKSTLKAFLILCTLLLSPVAFGVPYELYYSGRLTTLAGTPTEGPIDIEIKFFRSESGADEIAVTVPTFTSVSLEEGTFALSIQLTPAEFHTVFADSSSSPTYIQLKDTTHNQTYPRLVYSVVPFALKIPIDNSTMGYNSDGKLTVLNLSGDVTGAGGSTLVTKIQGNSVSNASPASGEVLKWNGSSWAPASAGGVGTVTSVASGTGLTGGPITGTGTLSLATSGVTAGTYAKVTVDTYGRATSGTTLGASDLPSSIDAAKIGGGTIDSTEFGYLNGVTSAIQTQIDGKAASSHTQAATTIGGGAVSDAEFGYLDGVTSAVQTQLNGKVAGPASATDNAIVRYDGTTGKLVQNSSNVVIDDSGNVGIGTTSPNYVLDIQNSNATGLTFLNLLNTNAGSGAFTQLRVQSQGGGVDIRKERNGYDVSFRRTDNGNSLLFVDGDGKVGIGTTAPSTLLHVANGSEKISSDTSSSLITMVSASADTNPGGRFNIYKARGGSVAVPTAINSGDWLNATYTYGYDGTGYIETSGIHVMSEGTISTNRIGSNIQFWTHPDSTSPNREVMRLSSSGNVGIGSSSPTQKLDVNGTVKATAFQGDGSSLTNVATTSIADNAVTSAKIADLGVGTADINTGAVTPAKIQGCSDTQILKMVGTNWTCSSDANSGGTVTSVATGTGLTGGTITGSGTISVAASGIGTTQLADNAITTAKITDANVTSAKIASGVDSAKIGSGTIDNTEFGYLNGVTSTIQTQFDGKVVGPASATDNAIARFDGTTGKLVQNSSVVIDDSGNVGIGTPSPSWQLNQYSTTRARHVIQGGTANTGTQGADTTWYDGTTSHSIGFANSIWGNGSSDFDISAGNSKNLNFTTSNAYRMTILSGGNVGIGTTNPVGPFEVRSSTTLPAGSPSMYLRGNNNTERFEVEGIDPAIQGKQHGGTIESPTATTAEMGLLRVHGLGRGDTNGILAAGMRFYSESTWTNSSAPTYINFYTTPPSSIAMTERMRINSSGNVGIGTSNPTSMLQIAGAIATAYVSKTAGTDGSPYAIAATDSVIAVNANSSAFTVTLPTATTTAGRQYTIKKIDSTNNLVTVATTGGQTIDGVTTYTIGKQWRFITVVSDGANWGIIGGANTNTAFYTQWGASTCSGTAVTTLSSGISFANHYTHPANGIPLCFKKNTTVGVAASYGGDILYGLSIQGGAVHTGNIVNDTKLQCAECAAVANSCFQLDGEQTCPNGYSAKYTGYMYGGHYTHGRLGHFCVDNVTYDSSMANAGTDNGAYAYPTGVWSSAGTTVTNSTYVKCAVCCAN